MSCLQFQKIKKITHGDKGYVRLIYKKSTNFTHIMTINDILVNDPGATNTSFPII